MKYHQATPQFRMFFGNDGYPYCRNSARNVSPHLFVTFLSVKIPNYSFFQYYLEGSSHKNQASIIPPTLQSSKYSPTCATETKREKSTKTFTSAINAAWKKVQNRFTVSQSAAWKTADCCIYVHKSCNFFMHPCGMQGLNRAPRHCGTGPRSP